MLRQHRPENIDYPRIMDCAAMGKWDSGRIVALPDKTQYLMPKAGLAQFCSHARIAG
jgi:hypothetical protein